MHARRGKLPVGARRDSGSGPRRGPRARTRRAAKCATIPRPLFYRVGKTSQGAQLFFDQFRFGRWPDYFSGVQVDQKPETLDQFFRSVTPNTGPYDPAALADGVSALVDRIGPAGLVMHSRAGGPDCLASCRASVR